MSRVQSPRDETLLQGIVDLGLAEGDYWSNDTSHTFGVAKSTDDQLQCFLRETLPDHRFTSGQFLSGFKSKTMEANDAIYEVAKRIRADDSLWELVMTTPASRLMNALEQHPASGPALQAIHDYLAIFGHQGYTLDFVEPPQSEDPTPFFATLKTMVANRDYSPTRHGIDARAKREKALADIEQLLDGLEYWQFRFRLWFTYRFYSIREETMFHLGSAWPVLRPLAAELGRRLVDAGTFARPDDIYFRVSSEIRDAIEARAKGEARPHPGALAAGRRVLREARKRLRRAPCHRKRATTRRWRRGNRYASRLDLKHPAIRFVEDERLASSGWRSLRTDAGRKGRARGGPSAVLRERCRPGAARALGGALDLRRDDRRACRQRPARGRRGANPAEYARAVACRGGGPLPTLRSRTDGQRRAPRAGADQSRPRREGGRGSSSVTRAVRRQRRPATTGRPAPPRTQTANRAR